MYEIGWTILFASSYCNTQKERYVLIHHVNCVVEYVLFSVLLLYDTVFTKTFIINTHFKECVSH